MSLANRGKGLERIIIGANNYYRTTGLADIVQMPTPVNVKTVTAKGEVRGHFQASTVDFYGTIKGGRALYFDAKETQEPRFAVADPKKLHKHQIDFLSGQHTLGALCFLVIDFTRQQEAYMLPWPVVLEYYNKAIALPPGARGKSIPLKECQERPEIFRIDTSKGYLNFLESYLSGGNL